MLKFYSLNVRLKTVSEKRLNVKISPIRQTGTDKQWRILLESVLSCLNYVKYAQGNKEINKN